MNTLEVDRLTHENDYLKKRCAQLQGDADDLSAQVTRLSQQLERAYAKHTAVHIPNPLSGGQ